MRVVVQRVLQAQVEVDSEIVGRIDRGLLVYLSVGRGDTESDVKFIADKLVHLRIFADDHNKMNLSVQDIGGSILLVSQFTLHGDCRKGRRPSFEASGGAELGQHLYEQAIEYIRRAQITVATGVFGAHMSIYSVNDGPVTLLLDSTRLF